MEEIKLSEDEESKYHIACFFDAIGYISRDFTGDGIGGIWLGNNLGIKKGSFVYLETLTIDKIKLDIYYDPSKTSKELGRLFLHYDEDIFVNPKKYQIEEFVSQKYVTMKTTLTVDS
jgi:hypothetical protein